MSELYKKSTMNTFLNFLTIFKFDRKSSTLLNKFTVPTIWINSLDFRQDEELKINYYIINKSRTKNRIIIRNEVDVARTRLSLYII